jgi:hypothetical protein
MKANKLKKTQLTTIQKVANKIQQISTKKHQNRSKKVPKKGRTSSTIQKKTQKTKSKKHNKDFNKNQSNKQNLTT